MNWIEYLTSPRGLALVNGMACGVFAIFVFIGLITRTINLGSAVPRIEKSKNPRAYWSVLFVYGAIVAWTGVSAASGFLKN